MNIGEANAVNKVLSFLLTGEGNSEDVEHAAEILAMGASKALSAGLRPEDVAKRWPDNLVDYALAMDVDEYDPTVELNEIAKGLLG